MLKTSSVNNFPYKASNVSYFYLYNNQLTELITYRDFKKAYDNTYPNWQEPRDPKIIAMRSSGDIITAYIVDDLDKFASVFLLDNYSGPALERKLIYPTVYIEDAHKMKEWGRLEIRIKFQTKKRDLRITDDNIVPVLSMALQKAIMANHFINKFNNHKIRINELEIHRDPVQVNEYYIDPNDPQRMVIRCSEGSRHHNACDWDFWRVVNSKTAAITLYRTPYHSLAEIPT